MSTGATEVRISIKADGTLAVNALKLTQNELKQTGDTATKQATLMASAARMIEHAFANIAIYGGIIQGYEALKQLTAGSVELGVEIGNLAKQTGISTETLSVLKYSSDITGISFEGLTKGTAKLSKSMLDAEEGKKQAINSFARLGITQAQVRDKSNDLYGMLTLLANRFQAIPDGPNKAAAAMGLFGKSGAALVPFLDQGSKGIEELRGQAEALGIVLTEEGVARMEQVHEAAVRLKGGFEGAGLGITAGLEPALVGLAAALQGANKDADAWHHIGEIIGYDAIYMASSIAALKESLKEAGAEFRIAAADALNFFEVGRAVVTLEDSDVADQRMQKHTQAAHMAALDIQKAQEEYKATLDSLNSTIDHYGDKPKSRQLGKSDDGEGVKVGDQSGNKPKSDDPIARAAADLVREQATAQADAQKQASQAMLAELDTQHRMLLVSDTDFYQEKLRLEVAALEAERATLQKQGAALQSLYEKQRGDKLLKRDKAGNSAEELRTQREILQVQERIGEVQAKSQALGSKNNAEVYTAGQARELAGLKTAADLERERDSGIAARLALLARENELEAAKVKASGGGDADVAQVQALGQVAAQKLRIAELDKHIRDSEQDNRRAVEAVNDAAAKDPRLKLAAAREINHLNADEARQLAVLAQQYDALAATLGGDFLQKAKDLHAEVDKLNRPDSKQDAAFTKSLVEGLEGVGNKMAETAGKGREAWHQMAVGIEQDMLRLALKLAEEKWLTPLLTGALGGQLPGQSGVRPTFATGLSAQPQTSGGGLFASAAGSLGAAAARSIGGGGQTDDGTDGPEAGGGGASSGVTGLLKGFGKSLLGGGGKGSGAPSVVINLTNSSSTPVSAAQTGQSWNADLKQFVVHAVLEDAGSGGMLSHLFGGGGG